MAERMETDVLVVGAGPAGLAAAVAASSRGRRVAMVDENPNAGGQIWRSRAGETHGRVHRQLAQLFQARVQILSPATVFDFESDDTARIAFPGGHGTIRFQKVVLATGAREFFLPFPGWTLPGVFGVGGLQAMVKQGMPIRGQRVAVAGTGPLLLAVAKHLRKHGAKVVGLFEQALPGTMRELALSLWRHPEKLRQAIGFYPTVTKLKPGWWVRQAFGETKLEAIEATDGTQTRRLSCEALACAYGLVPNVELAELAGCQVVRGFVGVDAYQRTSNERIFAAGEPVAIGGVEAAVIQGQIAGLAAADAPELAERSFKARAKAQEFALALERAFPIREEVRRLAQASTVVCRCEDVRWGEIEAYGSFREAKLHARLGMGPCQGRVCGSACRFLKGWEAPTVRPPLVPVPASSLIDEGESA